MCVMRLGLRVSDLGAGMVYRMGRWFEAPDQGPSGVERCGGLRLVMSRSGVLCPRLLLDVKVGVCGANTFSLVVCMDESSALPLVFVFVSHFLWRAL